MNRQWLSRLRSPLVVILLLYAVLAIVVQIHCADFLSSDGECYLRMAAYYAQGDWRHAIFGHWSPLGAWLAAPLVAAGMAPRCAFRLMIGLWGALAVVGCWRLAGRLGLGAPLRAAATACAALLAAEFAIDHRVDLLLTGLLLLYLDAAMDERLLASRWWALWVGVLGGVAYLAKLYALPFFLAHFTLAVLLRAWAAARQAEGTPSRARAWHPRRAALAWGLGLAGFAVVAAPWVAVLSAKLGRFTFGTAAGTSYALVGPGSGAARRQAILGLRRPPDGAYSVWQDATQDAARPAKGAPSPLSSGGALLRQLRVAGRNAARILGHLAALDEFHLGLVGLGLTVVAVAATRRRRETAVRHSIVLAAVLVFCGGYALIQAENPRYFWFVFLLLTVVAFHFAGAVPAALARRLGERRRRLLTAALAVLVIVSFAFHPVRFLGRVLHGPPPGREYRLVAEGLREMGLGGPLASVAPEPERGVERGWHRGLHVAYFLDAKYAGEPAARDAEGIVAEMRQAGARTLLVWGMPALAAALHEQPAPSLVGIIREGDVPGLTVDVAVFRLQHAQEESSNGTTPETSTSRPEEAGPGKRAAGACPLPRRVGEIRWRVATVTPACG